MKNKTFPIVADGFFIIIPIAVLAIVLICLKVTVVGVFFLAAALFCYLVFP